VLHVKQRQPLHQLRAMVDVVLQQVKGDPVPVRRRMVRVVGGIDLVELRLVRQETLDARERAPKLSLDVIARARRPGSLDSSIVHSSIRVNDFRRFFKTHPRIRLVCFNGAKAEALYKRLVFPALGSNYTIRYKRLPSTSPAHAALSRRRKLARWRAVLRRPAHRTKMPS